MFWIPAFLWTKELVAVAAPLVVRSLPSVLFEHRVDVGCRDVFFPELVRLHVLLVAGVFVLLLLAALLLTSAVPRCPGSIFSLGLLELQ